MSQPTGETNVHVPAHKGISVTIEFNAEWQNALQVLRDGVELFVTSNWGTPSPRSWSWVNSSCNTAVLVFRFGHRIGKPGEDQPAWLPSEFQRTDSDTPQGLRIALHIEDHTEFHPTLKDWDDMVVTVDITGPS
jgi:hypothetical protein